MPKILRQKLKLKLILFSKMKQKYKTYSAKFLLYDHLTFIVIAAYIAIHSFGKLTKKILLTASKTNSKAWGEGYEEHCSSRAFTVKHPKIPQSQSPGLYLRDFLSRPVETAGF